MSKFKDLLNELNINEKFNKRPKKEKVYTHVKDGIPLIEGYNYMADILYLPIAKFGFKYLLTMVDLATDKFDMEALKDKDSQVVLNAMLKIFKRGILKQPEYSIKTDNGSEFKGVFHWWLFKHDILQKYGLPYRHNQLANIEALNGQLSRLIHGYLNAKDEKNKKNNTNWIDILSIIRDKLNKIRVKKLPDDPYKHIYQSFNPYKEKEIKDKKTGLITKEYVEIKPKFKIGDMVHRKLEIPYNALGHKQNTLNFRVGDYTFSKETYRIKLVSYLGGDIPYRYVLDGIPNVSYTTTELMKA